jgi:histidine triad (HIT) family protein
MNENCLFCRIVKGEIPADIVARTDNAIAFRDISPKAPTHILVIPKEHVTSLDEVGDAMDPGSLLRLARQVAQQEGIGGSGYRVVINTGDDGGQTVNHLHLHVLGGRRMTWPPG